MVNLGELCQLVNQVSPSSQLLFRCCDTEAVVHVGAGKDDPWPGSLSPDNRQGHQPHISCWAPPVCPPAVPVSTGLPLTVPQASDQPPQGGVHSQ